MQGEKSAQGECFFIGSLDSLVPADDPFRRLEALLDLSWLRRETRALYSATGRPSIDPVVIAQLLLVAYLQGITSERELLRQVQVNLSYRRFLHYELSEMLPDHSCLTRSRQRLGEATVRKIFEYVLRLCLDAGLVGAELESVDSTFVQANASLASLRPRLVVAEAQRYTRQLFGADEDREGNDEQDGPPSGGGRRRRNDAVLSRTDPDAGLDRRRGIKSRLGFLVHFAVDRSRQIITGVLTTGAQQRDAGQLLPLVDLVRGHGILAQAVAADRGYSAGDVYAGLAERGITAFIPVPENGAEHRGVFGREHFTYDAAGDRYRCPNGTWLAREQAGTHERRYRARVEDCAPCPLRALCTNGRVRSLKVSLHEEHLAAARIRQHTRAGKRAGRDRRILSERMFAEAKDRHGLRRAHGRGLTNMRVQALLTATALNLKRYLQAQTRVFPAAAALRASLSGSHFQIRPSAAPC